MNTLRRLSILSPPNKVVLKRHQQQQQHYSWRVVAATANQQSIQHPRGNSSMEGGSILQRRYYFNTTIPNFAIPQKNQSNGVLLERYFSTTTSSEENTTTTPNIADNNSQPLQQQQQQVITDGKKQIQAYALQGEAALAQEILEQLETILFAPATTDLEKQEAETFLLECREAVLDAWISHQNLLIQELNSNNNNNNNKEQLKEIRQAAEYAHQALEKVVPFLSRPAMSIYTQTPKSASASATTPQSKGSDYLEEQEQDGGLGLTSTTTTISRQNAHAMLHRCNAVLTAWARVARVSSQYQTSSSSSSSSSKQSLILSRGIPQRAMFLLQRMEASTPVVQPTTESYNQCLEAWACSSEHLRGTMAEQLFQRMMKKKRTTKTNNNVDGESFRLIIEAWCRSKQKKSAFTATGHLMKLLKRLEKRGRDNNDTTSSSEEPTLELYHMVMESWTHAEDKNAPLKALSILRLMEAAHGKSYCSVPVDETCYRYYLLTSARRPVVPELGPIADQILSKLKERQIVPDADCYGAAIRTWKNSALNPLFSDSREVSVNRAFELLEEFSLAHHRSALRNVRPTTIHYNDALEALSASHRRDAMDRAEELLKTMEDSITTYNNNASSGAFDGSDPSDIRPNADSYRWHLQVYVNSKRIDKVDRAKKLLDRMQSNYETAVKDKSTDESIIGAHNAFIQVCASAKVDKDEQANTETLREALQAVQRMRSVYNIQPNSKTYSALLDVCKNVLPLGTERMGTIQSIFETCCHEGLVDEEVLSTLKHATSSEQYLSLVIGKSVDVEGTRMVPEEWTRNVGKERVITADGRRSAPLSVDGRYTITKAMKEYKMRKLRSKVNQRVLQGGRLKLDPKKRGRPMRIQLDEEAV